MVTHAKNTRTGTTVIEPIDDKHFYDHCRHPDLVAVGEQDWTWPTDQDAYFVADLLCRACGRQAKCRVTFHDDEPKA